MPGITGPGGGRVGAVLISPFIKPGTVSSTPYNHYSSLASFEQLFGLPRLADAASVPATFGAGRVQHGKGGRLGTGRRLEQCATMGRCTSPSRVTPRSSPRLPRTSSPNGSSATCWRPCSRTRGGEAPAPVARFWPTRWTRTARSVPLRCALRPGRCSSATSRTPPPTAHRSVACGRPRGGRGRRAVGERPCRSRGVEPPDRWELPVSDE